MYIISELQAMWEPVRAVFATFRFSDFLDIFLVAFVIFGVIKVARDSRTLQLIKGFLILGVIYFVITAFNMQASKFIFDKLFSNIVLVLIMLFQPEIRHAVETMGKSRFKSISSFITKGEQFKENERTAQSINFICKACSDMSDHKIGALIVVERGTLLGEIIETGTVVDAVLSEEIVGNIFYPKSPLHDGAAIIRQNKLYAAGCILPLTQHHSDVGSELGTRHRAAIGMSEQSDAFVIVVSEENGYISTAYKGTLRRDISDGELRERMNNLLLVGEGKNDRDKSRLKSFLRRNRK